MTDDPTCPLCLRPIPPGVPQSRHHLVPKLRGGKGGETVLLHHVCLRTIHKTLSETELARNYATVEALRAHEGLRRFWDWVGKRLAGEGAVKNLGSRARRAHDLYCDIRLGVNARHLVDNADVLKLDE